MSNFISLQEAVNMTSLYRKEMNEILAEPFKNKNILGICETVDKENLLKLLNKPGCEKLRIYYGMREDLGVHAILVAVNANDEDMLPTKQRDDNTTDEDLLDNLLKCPTICPPGSPLNS